MSVVFNSSSADHHGYWERTTAKLLLSELRISGTDTLFLDIGANIGSQTLPVANAGFQVFAVEPLNMNLVKVNKTVYNKS